MVIGSYAVPNSAVKPLTSSESLPLKAVTGAESTTVKAAPLAVIESSPSLTTADNASARLARLNQELAFAKLQQQIDVARQPPGTKDGKIPGKTIVIGVMINETGNRLATLRFPDGGTLEVELGSVINNMRVSEITLNGVTLVTTIPCKGRKCSPKSVSYARVYDAPLSSGINTQVQQGINQPTLFAPAAAENMVPQIISSN